MNEFLDKLSLRELILLTITVSVLAGGAYALARYVPAHKTIEQMHGDTKTKQAALLKIEIPEEVEGEADDLNDKIVALERQIEDARAYLPVFEQRLAPERSTELLLAISEAARRAKVRLIDNQSFDASQEIVSQASATAVPPRRLSRRAKTDPELRARQEARQKAREAAVIAKTATSTKDKDDDAKKSFLERVADGDLKRPLQRLTMSGHFHQIKQLIAELDELEWQVTVVQLHLTADNRDAPQGRPQLLNATMILAL